MKKTLHIVFVLFIAACANRVSPTGGDKDALAPELLEALPADKSLGFTAREIELNFNENVQLSDLQSQLLVSPLMDELPVVRANRRRVTVALPDSLKANTTYTISFGNAIVDVHESNPLKDFQYVFSTGAYLDTLFFKGKVVDAATLAPLKGITVVMYRNQDAFRDSAALLLKPDYFSKSDVSGDFTIRNLPPGDYRVFAFEDKNGNFICDDPATEPLSFTEKITSIPDSIQALLYCAPLAAGKQRVLKANAIDRATVQLVLSRSIKEIRLLEMDGGLWKGVVEVNASRDTIHLYQPDSLQDSLLVFLYDATNIIDTVRLSLLPDPGTTTSKFRLRLFQRASPAVSGPSADWLLQSNHPLLHADSIGVWEDSVTVHYVLPVISGSYNNLLRLTYPWQSGRSYRLMAAPGTIIDRYGLVNDTLRIQWTVPTPESTALLQLKVKGLVSGQNYLVQVLNEKFESLREQRVTADSVLTFAYLEAGKIRLRIVLDADGNGRWTTGDFGERRQPEKVWMYPETPLLRANWELELEFKIATP